jgi:predicted RNA-binding Zn-ribbon protein involved in translation (DUF1610 family)
MAETIKGEPISREPYCSSCGYVLTGLTESARCPECGKPLVEVLVRPGFALPKGKRYRSKATLFGMPVIDIALGPSGEELSGKARGIIAIGDDAMGWLAVGGFARGIVAVGGGAIGLFSIGGGAIGIGTALGGGAIGGIAVGGGAVGGITTGGGAIGWFAQGGGVIGYHSVGPMGPSSERTQDILDQFAWFFGPGTPNLWSIGQPMVWLLFVTFLAALIIGLIALIAMRGESDRDQLPENKLP